MDWDAFNETAVPASGSIDMAAARAADQKQWDVVKRVMRLAKTGLKTAALCTLAYFAADSAVNTYQKMTGKPSAGQVMAQEYRTVDDILAGTSFQRVDLGNVGTEIGKHENVVLFLYTNRMVDNYDGRLAEVFKAVAPEYKGKVTFLGLPSDGVSKEAYRKIGFTGSPAFAFYKNGKQVYVKTGGPPKGKVNNWKGIMKSVINKKLGF